MSQPSDALLAWLRNLLKQRGINSAQVAARADLPKARVRRLLSGAEPMLLDEFLAISQTLELAPEDLGLPAGAELPEEPPAQEPPGEAPRAPSAAEAIDPWGNQPRQLVEVGFALGCDFGLIVDTAQLEHSGIPRAVLERYQGGLMRIQLDAAYHQYNEPRYDDDALTLTLSFDALYDCTFPWSSVAQIVFSPISPEETSKPDEPDEGRPRLRLVT